LHFLWPRPNRILQAACGEIRSSQQPCSHRIFHTIFPSSRGELKRGKGRGAGDWVAMYVKGPTRASVAPLKYMLHLIGMISSVKYDFSMGPPILKGENPYLVMVRANLEFHIWG